MIKYVKWYQLSILFGLLCTGCLQGRSSTHELEHSVPPHWPADMQDAADKIQQRVAELALQSSNAPQVQRELLEIISWTPEVAAETDLSEAQWMTIYRLCEQLEQQQKKPKTDPQLYQQTIDQLCQQLRTLHAQLALSVPPAQPEDAEAEVTTAVSPDSPQDDSGKQTINQ